MNEQAPAGAPAGACFFDQTSITGGGDRRARAGDEGPLPDAAVVEIRAG